MLKKISSDKVYDSIRSLCERLAVGEYSKENLGSDNDWYLFGLVQQSMCLGKQGIEHVGKQFDLREARVVAEFSERMAILGVREKCRERLEAGLFALKLGSFKVDERDVLLIISLLFDASVRIGKSPKEIFLDVSKKMGRFDLIDNFLERNADDQSIEAMGYEVVIANDGFKYKRTW